MMDAPKIILLVVLILAGFLPSCSKEKESAPPAKEAGPVKTDAAPAAGGYQTTPITEGGTITGRVLFKGKHTSSTLSVNKDQEVCGKSKPDPSLILSAQGEVKDAVVQITDIQKGKPPAGKEVVLDQVKCEYVPHVLAINAGTSVKIKNSDGILHNVHTTSTANPAFNRAQPKYLKEITESFTKPEVIPVRCDVHGWMSAWIFVAAHPYYEVTSSDGSFKLAEVPPGSYTVEVWHETLGKQSQNVEVKPNDTVNVTFEFQSKS
jgi:plastocyanin